MANSAYEHVRTFETYPTLPPSNWIVIRLDGRSFTKFSTRHAFAKPNDLRALQLMNAAAAEVLRQFPDMVLAYGQSDEFSFVLREETALFERREAKLGSTVASAFTAAYCCFWGRFFGDEAEGKGLEPPFPSFDARCVCYPKRRILRDYLSWRQADCHINNLYNTTFWAMVLHGAISPRQAEEDLKGTLAKDKNEILWARYGINYNNEMEIYRKGSVIYRALEERGDKASAEAAEAASGEKKADPKSRTQMEKEKKKRLKASIVTEHVDIIGDDFWEQRPYLLKTRRDIPGDDDDDDVVDG